ncbi:hypothetical protein ACJX0J_035491, partial [Zea mays]
HYYREREIQMIIIDIIILAGRASYDIVILYMNVENYHGLGSYYTESSYNMFNARTTIHHMLITLGYLIMDEEEKARALEQTYLM